MTVTTYSSSAVLTTIGYVRLDELSPGHHRIERMSTHNGGDESPTPCVIDLKDESGVDVVWTVYIGGKVHSHHHGGGAHWQIGAFHWALQEVINLPVLDWLARMD